jgi:hypothetical protein
LLQAAFAGGAEAGTGTAAVFLQIGMKEGRFGFFVQDGGKGLLNGAPGKPPAAQRFGEGAGTFPGRAGKAGLYPPGSIAAVIDDAQSGEMSDYSPDARGGITPASQFTDYAETVLFRPGGKAQNSPFRPVTRGGKPESFHFNRIKFPARNIHALHRTFTE